jgi:hydroxyacylglutathione hydrolase
LIVDPGEAAPVIEAAARGLTPVAILLTHHHGDHTAGAAELLDRWKIPCLAPVDERIDSATDRVGDGSQVHIDRLGLRFEVLEVPGHTRSHIAFHGAGHLFCGDTLFSLGCGRMFEGTAPQMLASLDRLARLPDQTAVCCGHEYTLANAQFALHVDATNPALSRRVEAARTARQRGDPSVPSRIDEERACNPFLRTDSAEICDAIVRESGIRPSDRVEAFAALRRWKDHFRAV